MPTTLENEADVTGRGLVNVATRAVIGAYGFNPSDDLLAQLLALNLAAAEQADVTC
ncbi:MAG: hypothetical protein H7201_10165 [Candidatus Saccharibacteria bacterium]|nr:hypothetical protein [Microbacteriaceae bacterium]